MASNASAEKRGNRNLWYHLVWLDRNMGSFATRRKVSLLKEIDPDTATFASPEECIDYIDREERRNLTSSIVFLISGSLSQEMIPEIQDYRCVFAIFIFCQNYAAYEHLKYQKLRGIYTDADELIDSIEKCLTKFDETTDFSIFLDKTVPRPGKIISEIVN